MMSLSPVPTPTPVLLVLLRTLCLAGAVAFAAPDTAAAQYRFGVSFGGASTIAFVAEHRWEHLGLELQAGTWRFRDLSMSVTAKQYVGSYSVEPYIGAGLWGIVARAEEGTGVGLIARLPVGLSWDFASQHSAAFTVYLNRALALKRPDPEDRRPPRTTLIPLPEFSYRWQPGS